MCRQPEGCGSTWYLGVSSLWTAFGLPLLTPTDLRSARQNQSRAEAGALYSPLESYTNCRRRVERQHALPVVHTMMCNSMR
jgi:hypothetical protein